MIKILTKTKTSMRQIIGVMAAVVLLASCVSKGEYDAQVSKSDSLAAVCNKLKAESAAMQEELDGYRYEPAKLLAAIRENYAAKAYDTLKVNLDLMQRYHPEATEYQTAKGIYEQGLRDQEAARKKAEAEAAKREAERRAKMSKIERTMEKYNCDEETARLINKGQVRIGMTDKQCRAAWGNPSDINRSVYSFGVHEQWCYGGHNYLYFEDGILTSVQN